MAVSYQIIIFKVCTRAKTLDLTVKARAVISCPPCLEPCTEPIALALMSDSPAMHARYSTNDGEIWNREGPQVLKYAGVSVWD